MSQNVYDREDFFQEYLKLPRSQEGLTGALEWPILRELVGDVSNNSVLDLGCGFGWFCRWASDAGAKSVHGIDLSSKMLEGAKNAARQTDPVTYNIGDLETIQLPDGSYDLVYSSLAFHYVKDLKRLIQEIYKSLIPGGRFVFSVEHPIFTAPIDTPTFKPNDTKENSHIWPLDSYAEEGTRVRNWLSDGVVKQHRKIEGYVMELLEAGFVLDALREWTPSTEYVEANPQWNKERNRPLFLLLAAHIPSKES
jgi:SAM-dependent methyltransferase